MKHKKICVYCAASPRIDSIYFDATAQFAELLVAEQSEVIFGGGATGLMGHLADTVIKSKGKITGIMPHFMKVRERQHKDVINFHFVEDMRTRKRLLMEQADAIVALPGGTGTLDELMEVITLKKLGLCEKPIAILNTNNYYAPLKALFDKIDTEGFMDNQEHWHFVDHPEELIQYLHKNL